MSSQIYIHKCRRLISHTYTITQTALTPQFTRKCKQILISNNNKDQRYLALDNIQHFCSCYGALAATLNTI